MFNVNILEGKVIVTGAMNHESVAWQLYLCS